MSWRKHKKLSIVDNIQTHQIDDIVNRLQKSFPNLQFGNYNLRTTDGCFGCGETYKILFQNIVVLLPNFESYNLYHLAENEKGLIPMLFYLNVRALYQKLFPVSVYASACATTYVTTSNFTQLTNWVSTTTNATNITLNMPYTST